MDDPTPPPPASAGPTHPDILSYATPAPPRVLSASARCSRVALICTIFWIPATILTALTGLQTAGVTLFIGLPIFALILSFVARDLADGEPSDRRRSTLSLVIAGGACALLLGFWLLVPSMGKPREKANQVKCGSNLRQIGQAIMMYANDHRGQYPDSFAELISDQDLSTEVFICPTTNDEKAPVGATTQQTLANFAKPGHCSYIYLGKGMTSAVSPRHVVAYETLANHNHLGINVMFGDGHVDWLNVSEAKYQIAEIQAGHNPPRPPSLQR